MTLQELKSVLQKTRWFRHLGEPMVTGDGFVQIPNLAPWAIIRAGNEKLQEVADQMEWLPSSRDCDDPIRGRSLEERSEQLGKKSEFSQASMDVYKEALASLRSFEGHPALKIGPHDFTEAARGAALFASRRTAYEILLGDCGFWCLVMNVYKQGHSPCGILLTSKLVVL